jgi:hypothetical protein
MEETQVIPAETQNQAEPTAQNPEVAAPEASTEQTEAPKEQADPAEKVAKGLLRRVDRLTAARYQEQARADQAARDNEQLRQRLAQYEQPQEQPALSAENVMPIAQQLAHQMRETDKVRETVSTVLSKGKTLEGFDAACNAVNEALPFYSRDGRPTDFLRAVLEGDMPEKVLHHLGANPDVLDDLAGLSPTQVARRLDRIERDLALPKEPKQSTAPKAIAPVRSAAREDGGLSDGLSTEEWVKRFHKLRRG